MSANDEAAAPADVSSHRSDRSARPSAVRCVHRTGRIRGTDVELHVAELSTHSTWAMTSSSPSERAARSRASADRCRSRRRDRSGRRRCRGAPRPGRTRRGRRTSRSGVASWYSGFVSSTARSAPPTIATGGGEQAVVGTDEDAFAAGHLDRHRPASRADTRVDDGEHDARRDVARCSGPGRATRRARRTARCRG